jgi:cell division protein FtsA
MISMPPIGDDERDMPNQIAKSHLTRIIKPRVEEILELVRDRLNKSGFSAMRWARVVLTGGACQLTGLPEAARRILGGKVRIGRPLGVKGLPEAAKGPAFSAAVGLLIYPQVAHVEHFIRRQGISGLSHRNGRKTSSRVGSVAEGQFSEYR